MGRKLKALLVFALLAVPAIADAASYESQLEQGLFYLGRGSTYAPEAVRALESARRSDPEKAAGDGRLLGALARAYAVTSRYSEAFWLLESLASLSALSAEDEALRDRLLGQAGLGRIRVVCAVALSGIGARIAPAAGVRLDTAARKSLERLGELLARGVDADPQGIVFLAPEGVYQLAFDPAQLAAPDTPLELEVWAGDEVTLRLVPRYPVAEEWQIEAHSRSVALSWPGLEGASFRLSRLLGEEVQIVYRGTDPRYLDEGLPVGVSVEYRLDSLGEGSELLAVSSVRVRTLPPVSELFAEAHLGDDLRARVHWELGAGVADRLLVVREEGEPPVGVEEVVVQAPAAQGHVFQGPFLPESGARSLSFRVEVWVDDEQAPSAVQRVQAEVPPLVFKVAQVAESIDRGNVVVAWETLPRDGAAEGYAVFRRRGHDVEGELVGRAPSPFAREFEYPVENPLAAAGWRHFVLPYVGDRYVLDPDRMTFRGTAPESGLDRRHRMGQELPELGLSWAPYAGARGYLVTVGEKEVRVNRPYVEAAGLQSALLGTETPVAVFALDATGRRVLLLTANVRYEHYPRSASGLEGGDAP